MEKVRRFVARLIRRLASRVRPGPKPYTYDWYRQAEEEENRALLEEVREELRTNEGVIDRPNARPLRYAKGAAASFRLFMLTPADPDAHYGFAPSKRLEAEDDS